MSDPVEVLASRWPKRVTVTSSTKGVVSGVQSSPAAVWVVVAGIPGNKSMKFTAGFQRSWAELGDQIVGQSVMVSFVDDQPIVTDVIVGGS